MKQREFWQDSRSGLVWAVVFADGERVAANGPLDVRDADRRMLEYLPYTTHDLTWLADNWAHFILCTVCPVCSTVMARGASVAVTSGNGTVHLSCSLNPPAVDAGSAGACVRKETLWQASARLAVLSRHLRCTSARLLARGARLRATTRGLTEAAA